MHMPTKKITSDLSRSATPRVEALQSQKPTGIGSDVGPLSSMQISTPADALKAVREQHWTVRFIHAGWRAG
jgi:hypothetical protein